MWTRRDTVRMGRPTDAIKDTFLKMRLTEADKREIARLAKAEGLTMSGYMRKHLLRERVTVDRPKAKT